MAEPFKIDLTSFIRGNDEHWLCSQPDAALQMRAPAGLPIHPRAVRVSPKDFESDLSCADTAVHIKGGEGERRLNGSTIAVYDFTSVVVRRTYFVAVLAVHEDVEWRGTDAWSPVYAFKGGVVVAVVQPLMPKAIGVS